MKHESRIMNQAGFTLIETLIYLALFAIVIGGGMVALYQIIQSTDAANNKVIVQEEANFLLRKIDWALTGATAISVPSATSLISTKKINGVAAQLTFNLFGTNLTLKQDADPAVVLNSSSVSVSRLSFTKISVSGQADGITAVFALGPQVFSITKYLRK